MNKKAVILYVWLLLVIPETVLAQWDLPSILPPELYGNILINRVSTSAGLKSVTFSHWSHRTKYTCRVCHLELEFNMLLNSTPVTEEENKRGKYCGACHNEKVAFGHAKEHCHKCHNGDISYGIEGFKKLNYFPPAPYGNKIDWVEAMKSGLIKPKGHLNAADESPIKFEKELMLEAAWAMIPPAVFSHEAHTKWLDCSNCHPDIFNIKKKTTKHFAMDYLLEGGFCGVCHVSVAFPLNDCKRCHPAMKR